MERIEDLVKRIKEASQSYYENGKAVMTDYNFDNLVEELRELDPENEILHKPGFGYDTSKVGRREVFHEGELYTIELKIKNFEEFTKHYNTMRDIFGRPQYIQPKYDGISATGYYKDGKLTKLVTRGDGIKGFDIKDNVNLEGVENLIENGSARFEVVMSWEDWKSNYNTEENPSPRNLVAGICSKLKVEDWERKIARPVLLDVIEEGVGTRICIGFDDVEYASLLNISDIKDELPKEKYPTDGYVIKFYESEDKSNKLLGVYAFKPQNEMKETEITDIIWQEGNTGKLTPVLVINPINISGATISRVTGNSMSMMENLGTGIGARVKVFRSGEVIPCIGEVLERSENFNLPEFDFRKGAHIFRDKEVNLAKKVIYMLCNLKHFGKSLADKIIEVYGVKDLYDVLSVESDARLNGPVYSSKFTNHEKDLMSTAFDQIREFSYQEFLAGLNLPNIGWSAIDKIVKGEKLASHSRESWDKVKVEVEKYISALQINAGFNLKVKVEEVKEFKGKVAITGKHAMKRSEMETKLKEMGYEIQDGVNKDTDFLIIADVNSNSSKAKKARELGIKLVSSIEELM